MSRVLRLFSIPFATLALVAPGIAQAVDFVRVETFPGADPMAYAIQVRALPSGLLLVWDGNTIHRQVLVGGEEFDPIATGYVGDPGFMAISPDGHTVLLGAGYSGDLYLFDANAPADFTAEAQLATIGHYWGVFLTENLVLVDKATQDYSTCELAIIDISAPTPTATTVMLKPDAADLGAGEYAASAALAVDASRTTVYTMAVIYILDPYYMVVSNQLKRVSVSDLLDAYAGKALLDWDTDATAIGGPADFFSGGPAAVMNNGDVLVPGMGGVNRVDPATGTAVATYNPTGGPWDYYGAAYNPSTGDILPIASDPVDYQTDNVYAPEGAFAELPTLGGMGLVILAAAFAVAGGRRVRR